MTSSNDLDEARLTRVVFHETRSLMSDIEKELQHRVDAFVNELSALIRRQAEHLPRDRIPKYHRRPEQSETSARLSI